MEVETCPKCPACKVDFDLRTRRPLLLPCFHVTCSACVVSQSGRVTCPTCSKVKVLSGSEELPNDVCTANEVSLAMLPSLPCDQCEVEGHTTHRCTMCRSLLCKDCVTQHARMKIFRKHRPVPLSNGQEVRQEFLKEVALCQDGNIPSGFCRTCSSAVCPECQDDHQGSQHDYATLAHAQHEAHAEHSQLLKELNSRRGKLESFRECAVAANAKSQDIVENCGNQLLEVRNQLLQAVHGRVGQLQARLREVTRVQGSRHNSNMATLGQSMAEVEAAESYLTRLALEVQPAQLLATLPAQTSSVRSLLASPACPSAVDLRPHQVKLDTTNLQRALDLVSSVGDVMESSEMVETEPEEVFCNGDCPEKLQCCQERDLLLQEPRGTSEELPPEPAEEKGRPGSLEEEVEVDGVMKLSEVGEKAPEGSSITLQDVLEQAPDVSEFTRFLEASTESSEGSTTLCMKVETDEEAKLPSASPPPFKRESSLRKAMSNIVSRLTTEKGDKENTLPQPLPSHYSHDVPRAMPELRPKPLSPDFCPDCVNLDDFSVRDRALTNSAGCRKSQEDELHQHRPCPSPWNMPYRAPHCDRLRRYWGTLGNVVVGNGCFSWRVKVRAWTQRQTWGENSYLFEMGVMRPELLDSGTQALGGREGGGWGIDVIFCITHGGLCARGRGSGDKMAKHALLGDAMASGRVVEAHFSFTVDTVSGAMVCKNATKGVQLCEFQGVFPPLLLFFGLRPGGLAPHYKLEMEMDS